jgi:hypothetical protein
VFQKILHRLQVRKFGSLPAVWTTCHPVRTPSCPMHQPSRGRDIPSGRTSDKSIIRPDDVDFRPDLPLCREASNYSSLHPSGRFSSPSGRLSVFDQASGFFFQTQIWEDCCNRPDDVVSCPDALIHKESIAIQIQQSGRQSAWSGHACIGYGNCVHQISRSDDHPPSPDAQSLYMEITYSGRATVRMTVPHRPNAAFKQERSSGKFLEFWSHSCSSGRPMTTVRTAPSFIEPDSHLSPQPINRGPCA